MEIQGRIKTIFATETVGQNGFQKRDVAKSPLTKKIYKGFSKDKEGFKEWLMKVINQDYLIIN